MRPCAPYTGTGTEIGGGASPGRRGPDLPPRSKERRLIGSLVVHHVRAVLQRGKGPLCRGTLGPFRREAPIVPNRLRLPSSAPGLTPYPITLSTSNTSRLAGRTRPSGYPPPHEQCWVKAGMSHPRHSPRSGPVPTPASTRCLSDDTITRRSAAPGLCYRSGEVGGGE